MTFEDWWNKDLDDNEEWLYDVSGDDWEGLVTAMKKAYEAGWNARYQSLTTKSI
jgi:HKD family nuclease